MTRPALRGQGYMKKGGAAATRLHNELHAVAPVEPTPDAARGRASGTVSWPLLASAWVAGVGMGGTTAALLTVSVMR